MDYCTFLSRRTHPVFGPRIIVVRRLTQRRMAYACIGDDLELLLT
jgi:hypothetical protein